MSFKNLYRFSELDIKAQKFAVSEYIEGWNETHERDILDLTELEGNLKHSDALYTENGILVDDSAECCENCGDALRAENNNYNSEKCDSCIEYLIDKMSSNKGETY